MSERVSPEDFRRAAEKFREKHEPRCKQSTTDQQHGSFAILIMVTPGMTTYAIVYINTIEREDQRLSLIHI